MDREISPRMKNLLKPWVSRRAGGARALIFAFTLAAPPILAAAGPSSATVAQTEMLARVFPSIVRIEAIRLMPFDGHLTKAWTAGSGVIITAEGHVLTNCHVSEDVDAFRCYLYDGQHVDAHRVGQDPLTDIAVLQLDLTQLKKGAGALPVAVFGNSDRMKPGDTVFALAAPGSYPSPSPRVSCRTRPLCFPSAPSGG